MNDTINGRTPEEIKNGIDDAMEEASWAMGGGDAHDLLDALEKTYASLAEALAYIQQLERERDAAVELIKGNCKECKHVAEKWFPECRMNPFCLKCLTNDYCNWQWRGVQNEVEG